MPTMTRPTVYEPEDCLFPQARIRILKILIRKEPQGSESWDGISPTERLTYTLALIQWDGEARLAWRYDGGPGHPVGWPSSSGYPSWAIIPRPDQPLYMPRIPIEYHQMVLDAFQANQV